MSGFKKYMVVPYVNSIEKPNDSFIENADRNMSDIIKDSKMPDDLKMQLYHQNLNKFLLKYDPESYGVTPTLVKLAKTVSDFIEHKNVSHVEEPSIKNEKIFEPSIKNEQFLDKPFKFESFTPAKTPFDENRYPSDYNYHEPSYYETNKDLYKLTGDDSINATVNYSNQDSLGHLDETVKTLNNTLIKNYEANTNPAANTRQNSRATHEQGEYGDVKIVKPVAQKKQNSKKLNTGLFGSNPKVQHSPQKNGSGQTWTTTESNKFF